jgi:hypothetical protein
LGKKGGDEIVQVLFVGVPKVKVKIAHRCLSFLANGCNIFDDCGTDTRSTILERKGKGATNQRILLPDPAMEEEEEGAMR